MVHVEAVWLRAFAPGRSAAGRFGEGRNCAELWHALFCGSGGSKWDAPLRGLDLEGAPVTGAQQEPWVTRGDASARVEESRGEGARARAPLPADGTEAEEAGWWEAPKRAPAVGWSSWISSRPGGRHLRFRQLAGARRN